MRKFAVLLVSLTTLIASVLPAQASTVNKYVALGDSYSTGAGLPGTLPGICLDNPQNSYAGLVAHDLGAQLQLVACNGAKTTDIIATQLQFVTRDTDLVTLTAGGNDAGTFDVLPICATTADCTGPIGDAFLDRIKHDLGPKLTALYRAIAQRIGPTTKVRVLGYPLLIWPSMFGGSNNDPTCPAFSAGERLLGAKATLLFDSVTRNTVATLGDPRFEYVSAIDLEWVLHTICGPRTPFFFGSQALIRFHPDGAGHGVYKRLLEQTLN